MAVDVAMMFLEHPVGLDQLVGVVNEVSNAERVICCIGNSPNRISFWCDGAFEIESAACVLSNIGSVCLAWKAEHADVAGWSTFRSGRILEWGAGPCDPFLSDSIQKVERTLGLGLNIEDYWTFPDILIDEEMTCAQFSRVNNAYMLSMLPGSTVIALLEGDLPLEPVLPNEVRT